MRKNGNTEKKKKYSKPRIEHVEKINRVFLACRAQISGCTETLQQINACPT